MMFIETSLKIIKDQLDIITNEVKKMTVDAVKQCKPRIDPTIPWGVGDTLRGESFGHMYILLSEPITYKGNKHALVQIRNESNPPMEAVLDYFERTDIDEIKENDVVRHKVHGICIVRKMDIDRSPYKYWLVDIDDNFVGWNKRDAFARCCLRENK